MDYPKLNHPPVVEAIMGVSILENEFWQSYYGEVSDLISNAYSVVNERVVFRSKSRSNSNSSESDTLKPEVIKDGYTLANPSEKKILLLKPDLLQITKKAPYVEWEDLFINFRNALQAINSAAPNVVFHRPFLKYRNQFEFPVNSEASMDEHFKIVHLIPEVLAKFSIHSMNFSVDASDDDILYKIEQNLKPSADVGKIIAAINIDVFDASVNSQSSPIVLSSIENLRQRKNKIFFSLITENLLNNFL